MTDLTKMLLPTDGEPTAQTDHGVSSVARVEAIFRNHRERLIEEIARYQVVVGCVAWLTDYAVLDALAGCESVSIVVQKEDFLKPDTRGSNRRLKRYYDALPGGNRHDLPYLGGYSYCSLGSCDSVRCVGNHNADRKPAWPRMHNKFLVFCEHEKRIDGDREYLVPVPVKVWTGSYNISDNASRSWENAILIDDPVIADAYAREFGQIFGFSEPLDWQSAWTAPTYRIGS